MSNKNKIIIEKRLGIAPDYQYKAINSKNFLQANWHKNKLFVLKKVLNLNKQSRILDLGAGSGNFEFNFHRQVGEIVGLDYNEEALDFVKAKLKDQKIKNVKLVLMDLKDLPKAKSLGKFDTIIMIDVIEHLPIATANEVVKSFKKLLNSGGQVVIITPNYKSSWLLLEEILDKISLVPKLHGHQHLAKYHQHNIKQLFEKHDFQTKGIKFFNLVSFLAPNDDLSRSICHLELTLLPALGNLLLADFNLKD